MVASVRRASKPEKTHRLMVCPVEGLVEWVWKGYLRGYLKQMTLVIMMLWCVGRRCMDID